MQLLKSDMKDAGDSHDIERWQQFLIGHGVGVPQEKLPSPITEGTHMG
jgi:hypothetical protein